jgi:hypothetical protein
LILEWQYGFIRIYQRLMEHPTDKIDLLNNSQDEVDVSTQETRSSHNLSPVVLDRDVFLDLHTSRTKEKSYYNIILRTKTELEKIKTKMDWVQKCLEEIIELGRIGIKDEVELDRILSDYECCKHFIDKIDKQKRILHITQMRLDKYEQELITHQTERIHLEEAFGIRSDQKIIMEEPLKQEKYRDSRNRSQIHDLDENDRDPFLVTQNRDNHRNPYYDHHRNPYYDHHRDREPYHNYIRRNWGDEDDDQKTTNTTIQHDQDNVEKDFNDQVHLPDDQCVDPSQSEEVIIQDLNDLE